MPYIYPQYYSNHVPHESTQYHPNIPAVYSTDYVPFDHAEYSTNFVPIVRSYNVSIDDAHHVPVVRPVYSAHDDALHVPHDFTNHNSKYGNLIFCSFQFHSFFLMFVAGSIPKFQQSI